MKFKSILYEYDLPMDIFEKLMKAECVGIDTESLGLHVKRDRLCLIQITDFQEFVYLIHFPKPIYNKSQNISKLLVNTKIEKIFHFARFDVGIIYEYLKVMCTNIICTKIMSKISRTYTERHGLKELCSKLLSVELSKGNGSSYWGGPLDEGQIKYAADDVIYLLDLKNKLIEMLKLEKRWNLAVLVFKSIQMVVTCDVMGYDPVMLINHH
jgi:ribonuclease D